MSFCWSWSRRRSTASWLRRIYEATATVEVQPQARRLAPGQDVSGIGAGSYGWFAEEKYQNTQVEIIKSRAIAERAFEILGLKNDPRFVEAKDPVGVLRGMIRVVPRRETGLDRDQHAQHAIPTTPPGASTRSATPSSTAISSGRRTTPSRRCKSITYAHEAPRGPADGSRRRSGSASSKETESYNPETQQEIVRQRLTKLNEQLNTTQLEVGRLQTLLAKIQQIQDGQGDPMSIPELAKDEVLQRLGSRQGQLERDFEAVKVTYRPGATAYQEAEIPAREDQAAHPGPGRGPPGRAPQSSTSSR